MIEEVEDDESGRTGPPGTIGERTIGEQAHEYMSENIESNVINRVKKNAPGNQSMKAGAGKPMHNQNNQKFE